MLQVVKFERYLTFENEILIILSYYFQKRETQTKMNYIYFIILLDGSWYKIYTSWYKIYSNSITIKCKFVFQK